ncbi:hypothetical protein chiPu_0032449, partial [Chiloscyllium punctatum]|nr:hypothetical protein [Chiloscyllium punctatum]
MRTSDTGDHDGKSEECRYWGNMLDKLRNADIGSVMENVRNANTGECDGEREECRYWERDGESEEHRYWKFDGEMQIVGNVT